MMEDKSRIKILEHSLIDIPASVNASDVIIIEQNDETKNSIFIIMQFKEKEK